MITGSDFTALEQQQDALLEKINAEYERLDLIKKTTGTIDDDMLNQIIQLEKRVANLGSESAKNLESLQKQKKESEVIAKIRDSIKFLDLPEKEIKTGASGTSADDIKRIEAEAGLNEQISDPKHLEFYGAHMRLNLLTKISDDFSLRVEAMTKISEALAKQYDIPSESKSPLPPSSPDADFPDPSQPSLPKISKISKCSPDIRMIADLDPARWGLYLDH
jgi:hypothetical protein